MDDNYNLPILNRLMEFGLSMGMAQQMVNMMNQTMQNMQIPVSGNPVQPKSQEWYVAINGKACGPFSESEMKNLLLERKVTKGTLVWCSGMREWAAIENTPEALKLITLLPPAL